MFEYQKVLFGWGMYRLLPPTAIAKLVFNCQSNYNLLISRWGALKNHFSDNY